MRVNRLSLFVLLLFLFGPAFAQESQIQVPFFDARPDGPDKLQAGASSPSKNGITLLYLGDSQEEFDAISSTLNEALRIGLPIIGITIGTLADGPVSRLEIYSNLYWAGDISTRDVSLLQTKLLMAIKTAHQKFIIDGFVSEEQLDGEPLEVVELRRIDFAIEQNQERIKTLERQQRALQDHLDSIENQN